MNVETRLEKIAILALAISAVLLGLQAAVPAFPSEVRNNTTLWHLDLWSGAVLAVIGMVCGIVYWVLDARTYMPGAFDHLVRRTTGEAYQFTNFALMSDLPILYAEFVREFGKDVPSVRKMEGWLKKCPTSFVMMYCQEETKLGMVQKFVGSYKFLPLTAVGVSDLLAGDTSGSEFRDEHISGSNQKPEAYYIGDLFAIGDFARGAILFHLDGKCGEVVENGIPVYARPFTKRGKKVMMKRGFRQVSNNSRDLEIRALCRLTRQPKPRFPGT